MIPLDLTIPGLCHTLEDRIPLSVERSYLFEQRDISPSLSSLLEGMIVHEVSWLCPWLSMYNTVSYLLASTYSLLRTILVS